MRAGGRHRGRVTLSLRAPAKLNLSLAVVGRGADGFHRLVSCVAPVTLADALEFTPGGSADRLSCDDPALPADGANLVLRAAAVFRTAHSSAPHGHFRLAKSIPHGAGLGGGSSDAAAALRLLNQASGEPFDADQLRRLAAQVGSDCAFFVEPALAVMRGRGYILERLPDATAAAFKRRRVLLLKPAFGVATVDAYGWLAADGRYATEPGAEAALAAALSAPEKVVALGNDLQAPVFARRPELPAGLAALRASLGIAAVMTGSGSACFALVDCTVDLAAVRAALKPAWGEGVWVQLAELA